MSFSAPAAPLVEDFVDPIDAGLSEAMRELIYVGQALSDRSMQTTVGMSELGTACERKLWHKTHATPPVNFDIDPLTSVVGRGAHLELAEIVGRQNQSGRWLIEEPVVYREVPGTVDLYDRRRKIVFDWKTTSKSKLRKIRTDGPQPGYVTQIQGYGQALKGLGEDVQRVALVFIPRDGALADLYVWSAIPNPAVVDEAIDRFNRISQAEFEAAPATPTQLCGWCPFFLPGSTDLTRGCPGSTTPKG